MGLVLFASVGAHATTIFVEAESARYGANGSRITTPMLIKDDDLASNGGYIEVIPGNNSKDTMPATEGVATLKFDNPDTTATFTMWARVIASFDGDDSFWLKMDNGSAIKWNGFQIGTSWHWVHVTPDGGSNPSQFSLASGTHTLKVAYREDGTKLDAFIITSDSSFNPNTVTGAPGTPILENDFNSQTNNGTILSWSESPGATSYTLTDENSNVLQTGLTTHQLVETNGCFRVIAVGPGGSSLPTGIECAFAGDLVLRLLPVDVMSAVSPMKISGVSLATQSGTAESLNVVPAHGRGRFDFRVAGSFTMEVWAEVTAPDGNNDSFWVRMDQGTWIKWNNISPVGCVPIVDSDHGSAKVQFNLTGGSHFLEFAYREIGAAIDKFAPTSPTMQPPCED